MSIWETLGEIIGRAFKSVVDSIIGLLQYKPAQLTAIDTELAGASLDPEKFRTQEVKDLIKDLKEKLETSPSGLADWIQTIMHGFMVKIWDVAIGIMLPTTMPDFNTAKASATWMSNLFADFVILSASLDMVGTALSATLVRNLIHTFRLFAATFGMDRYLDAVIAPALATSIVPMLTRGYNAQYKTFIPPAADLVRWQAHEVFEPSMRAKYGLDAEKEELVRKWFYEDGLSDEMIDNYWADHWEHASWIQVIEMLHRGELTEDEVREWFKLVEIPPYWRQKLINVSWNVPTRVDVRRWWDMRTIDEARLKEIYAWLGYHGKDLDDYVLWTKVYVAFPDLLARFTNDWIHKEDVRNELVRLGMPSERVDEMMQTKIKNAAPQRVTKERDLTKAEIVKGVKKGILNEGEGAELLEDMGYDEDEAWYILQINVAAETGSPESFMEFKQITQMYRKAVGLEAKIPPAELQEAEKALKEAETELKAKIAEGTKEEKLLPYQKAKDDAAYRYRQLLTQWREQTKTS